MSAGSGHTAATTQQVHTMCCLSSFVYAVLRCNKLPANMLCIVDTHTPTHRDKHAQTDRQTQRPAHTQLHRQTYTKSHTYTHRQTDTGTQTHTKKGTQTDKDIYTDRHRHTHRYTDRHTQNHTHTQTDTGTHTHTHSCTDRQTDRHRLTERGHTKWGANLSAGRPICISSSSFKAPRSEWKQSSKAAASLASAVLAPLPWPAIGSYSAACFSSMYTANTCRHSRIGVAGKHPCRTQ